jgi:hypothetical protein
MAESGQIAKRTRALERAEQTFGVVSKEYSTAMAELALGWKSHGDLDRAIQLESKVADLDRQIYGADSYEFVNSRYKLANSLAEAGDAPTAATIQRVLVIEVIDRVGYNTKMSTQVMGALADSLFVDHQYEELKGLLQRLIPANREVYGTFSSNELEARSMLGRCFLLMGLPEEAYEIDLEIVRNLTNENDIDSRIKFQARLINDCVALEKWEEVFGLLTTIFDESKGLSRKRRREVRGLLLGNPDFISVREFESDPVEGSAIREMFAKLEEL